MPAEVQRLPGREHPRVPFGSDIAVQVPDWAALRARALDVSYGGMSLVLARPLRVGDRLVFGLAMPTGVGLEVEAIVRNVVPLESGRFRVGLEWTSLPPEARNELRLFVDAIAEAA